MDPNYEHVLEIFDQFSVHITNLLTEFNSGLEDLKQFADGDELESKNDLDLKKAAVLKDISNTQHELTKKLESNGNDLLKKKNKLNELAGELANDEKYLMELNNKLEKLKLKQKKKEKLMEELLELKLKVKVCKLLTCTNFEYVKPHVSGYMKGQKACNYKAFNLDLPKLGQEEVTKRLYDMLSDIVKEDLK